MRRGGEGVDRTQRKLVKFERCFSCSYIRRRRRYRGVPGTGEDKVSSKKIQFEKTNLPNTPQSKHASRGGRLVPHSQSAPGHFSKTSASYRIHYSSKR